MTQQPPDVRAHNESRFKSYKAFFKEFIEGDAYDPNQGAHMLHDVRWDEVPRGLAAALYNAARRGPIRSNIGKSFNGLISLSVYYAFADLDRSTVQPWILQNWDFFFVAVLDGLLLLNQKNTLLRQKVISFRRSIDALLEMIEASKKYMSLDSAAESTGLHAIMAATVSTRGSFIKNGLAQINGDCIQYEDPSSRRDLTLAHVIAVDMIADGILKEPNRDITTWKHAFGFYVGSNAWRELSARCQHYMPFGSYTKNIISLEIEIENAHERLNAHALAVKQQLSYENAMEAGSKKINKKRKTKNMDLVDVVMAIVPNPLSPGGTISKEALLDQCATFLHASSELTKHQERATRIEGVRQCLASPCEMIDEKIPANFDNSDHEEPYESPQMRNASEPPPVPVPVSANRLKNPVVRLRLEGLFEAAAKGVEI